ncbi:MAG: hypothetical protein JO025_10850 [Verrucomicrobia bacterium]|nr:hypothetical protein [Verrucomicrobiota bacterium]
MADPELVGIYWAELSEFVKATRAIAQDSGAAFSDPELLGLAMHFHLLDRLGDIRVDIQKDLREIREHTADIESNTGGLARDVPAVTSAIKKLDR